MFWRAVSFFLGLFRRILCFLNIRRGRRDSGTLLPLHQTSNNGDISQTQGQYSSKSGGDDLVAWDSWGGGDGAPAPSAQSQKFAAVGSAPAHPFHIPQQPAQPEEQAIDFFHDIEPKVKRTKKLYIGNESQQQYSNGQKSSRFAVSHENELVPAQMELGEWDEDAGWDVEETDDVVVGGASGSSRGSGSGRQKTRR